MENISVLTDYRKYKLIQQPWQPPADYLFPYSTHNKNEKTEKRFFQRHHLTDHHWLVFSDVKKGLYCKYCVLFACETGHFQTNTVLQKLVKTPLTSFAKLTGKDGALTMHASRKYHISSVQAGQDFIKTYENPTLEVVNQVSSHRNLQVLENRKRLRPIIETIILCGRQNIALRGHRDDGNIGTSNSFVNEGNFRALLRYRIAGGDKLLEKHLETASSKATNISKTTQNDIIDCCKEEIQNTIVNRTKTAVFYSVIFDETTDISHIEQLSLSLRYIWDGKIREDFLTFVDAYESIRQDDVENNERRLSGKALGHCVIDLLKKFELPFKNCVGIGTDNCSVMASDVKGAVQEIVKSCVNARRCPCFNHSLNNSLAKSSQLMQIRNTIGTMKKIISFVNSSAKKSKIFHNNMNISVRGLCETRWSERHDGVLQFQHCLTEMVKSLEEIALWQDRKTSSDADSLIKAICDSEFIVSTICLGDVLSITRSLSLLLQAPSLDLIGGNNALKLTLQALKTCRESADGHFNKLFATANNLAAEIATTIEIPRIVKRQTNRANYSACSSAEEYYRKAIFIPLLDNIIVDLEERLPKDTLDSFKLMQLMPSNIINKLSTEKDVQSIGTYYSELLGSNVNSLCGEYVIWQEFWKSKHKNENSLPDSVLDVLEASNKFMYPTIYELLKILATLPVSVATAERSFSTLRRLKTWTRTQIGEERLTGLALLHIHFDINVDVEGVIENFAKSKKRKCDFVL